MIESWSRLLLFWRTKCSPENDDAALSLARFQKYWKSSRLTTIFTSPLPIFFHIRVTSSRKMMVDMGIIGGGMKVPSRMVVSVPVLTERMIDF